MSKRQMKAVDYKAAMMRVIDVMYLDRDLRDEFHNPDKEWGPDTLEDIRDVVAATMRMRGRPNGHATVTQRPDVHEAST